ncbi:MAG: SGNH/GDSL hydrolase family protein [Verrucomicrobiota bacterium]
MKKLICFGDTITEMGFVIEVRGFVAQLADRYTRRADVLLRGFTGYTTREGRKILPSAVLSQKPDFVIMFFGMNDSALPGQIQHVPVQEFKENLQDMASRIATEGAWLVLVTPPPVDERRIRSRTMAHTAQYAQACVDVASEMNVPVVDLFHKLQEEKNWTTACLQDGLHLSAHGMNRFYDELALALDRIRALDTFERLGVDGI